MVAHPRPVAAWVLTAKGPYACQVFERPNGVVPAPNEARQRQSHQYSIIGAGSGRVIGHYLSPNDVLR